MVPTWWPASHREHPSKADETLRIVLGLLPIESLSAAAAVQIGFNTVNNPSVDRLHVSSHTAPLDCGRIRAQSYRRIHVAGQVGPRGEIPLRLPLGKIGGRCNGCDTTVGSRGPYRRPTSVGTVDKQFWREHLLIRPPRSEIAPHKIISERLPLVGRIHPPRQPQPGISAGKSIRKQFCRLGENTTRRQGRNNG